MAYFNQKGEPIREVGLFSCVGQTPYVTIGDQERNDAIALILAHFGLEIVLTNDTKHGNEEMVLRKIDNGEI